MGSNQNKLRRYQARNCKSCPLNGICYKAKGIRIIEVNFNLLRLRNIANELLNTQEGNERRKQRCHDVETVFGNIKHNHGARRFMLHGKGKDVIELGLLAIAQNIRKTTA